MNDKNREIAIIAVETVLRAIAMFIMAIGSLMLGLFLILAVGFICGYFKYSAKRIEQIKPDRQRVLMILGLAAIVMFVGLPLAPNELSPLTLAADDFLFKMIGFIFVSTGAAVIGTVSGTFVRVLRKG